MSKIRLELDTKIEKVKVTENQLKVIKDKYLRDAPSVENWLISIAENIALAELLYDKNVDQNQLIKGVKFAIEDFDDYGKKIRMLLLHKDLIHHSERMQNFKVFMNNLYEIVETNQKVKENFAETRNKFYKLMASWEFLPNSPTLMNAGRDLQQLSACFVLPIEDSIEGWMKAAFDTAMIHKSGGGTGFSASRIRPRGDKVSSTSGVASGPLSPLKIIDGITAQIKQGGTRRGANMGILSVYHPDILEFIHVKEKPGELENFNISVAIDEPFMKAVREDKEIELINPKDKSVSKKVKAKQIWKDVVEGAWKTGDPGYVVIDRINNSESNPTPAQGMIESTNPCVAEGTLVNTPYGYKLVEELNVGDEISTVLGSEPINAIEVHEDIPVFRIKFSDGGEQIVTAAHKYYAIKKGSHSKQLKDYRLDELKIGDYVRVEPCLLKKTDSNKYFDGIRKGILLGDGCYTEYCHKKNIVKIASNIDDVEYNKKIKELFDAWKFRKDDPSKNSKSINMLISDGRNLLQSIGLKQAYSYEKTFDISLTTSIEEVIGILDGLLATDGDILLKSNHPQIRFTTSSKELAQNIRRLLLMIGCHGRIFESFEGDGGIINGRKIIRKHHKYNVIVSGSSAGKLAKISRLHNLDSKKGDKLKELTKLWLATGNTWKAQIISIEKAGNTKVYDLYCKESDTWVTDGYVQRGCGEQPLLPYEPCNLGSINLSKFVKKDLSGIDYERLKQCIFDCTHFLDNVIDVNNYPLPEIEYMAKKNRRVGLGVMGWAETLAMIKIPYNSDDAFNLAEEVMEFINYNSLKASEQLAEERGVFPGYKDCIYDKKGRFFKGLEAYPRNSARTTIAPTGTIGITAGLQGAGIEPFFAIVYVRYNAAAIDALKEGKTPNEKDTFYEINLIFKKIAQENDYFGLNPKELWKKIDENHKSVIGIKEIPEDIQKIFLTAHDLKPLDHVRMQCAFQKYTNNAVSKTVNLKNEATIKDVEEVYKLAYDYGAKGVTIYRDGSKDLQILNINEKKKEIKERCGELSNYYELNTGQGPLHIHINYDEIGPTRVFANISPTGTEISGMTTAIAILLSKYFELGGEPTKILKHLNSIKGDRPFGFGKNRVDSIPHALAKALRDHLVKTGKIQDYSGQTSLEGWGKIEKKDNNVEISLHCPKCFSTNVAVVSGCEEPTCFDCGYSKCS